MKRSFLRAQQHVDDRRSVYSSIGMDIADLSKKSAYRGYRKTADEPRSATIVPMEDGYASHSFFLVLYFADQELASGPKYMTVWAGSYSIAPSALNGPRVGCSSMMP